MRRARGIKPLHQTKRATSVGKSGEVSRITRDDQFIDCPAARRSIAVAIETQGEEQLGGFFEKHVGDAPLVRTYCLAAARAEHLEEANIPAKRTSLAEVDMHIHMHVKVCREQAERQSNSD